MSVWSVWPVVLLAGLPWIVGIVYYWRHRVRDGSVPPSLAEQVRNRLWIQ
jgi:hypothetical protein